MCATANINKFPNLNFLTHRYVITKLRNQEHIAAELYESATVLFSDIPVFADLVNNYAPLILVEFLNAVYSTLDDAVGQYDAYKVETISDSYLVSQRQILSTEGQCSKLGQFFQMPAGTE